ncbi:hypothetical protein AAFP30_21685 [Gordonia sp. CPCC 205515]
MPGPNGQQPGPAPKPKQQHPAPPRPRRRRRVWNRRLHRWDWVWF